MIAGRGASEEIPQMKKPVKENGVFDCSWGEGMKKDK